MLLFSGDDSIAVSKNLSAGLDHPEGRLEQGLDFSPSVFQIDPLTDDRWTRLVDCDPNATIFHTREWLRALHQTFGYQPKVFTLSAADEHLRNGIPFCEVRSWLTGRRLVGLPFSDHCDPLGSEKEIGQLLHDLPSVLGKDKLKYIEIRPLRNILATDFARQEVFRFHLLDLRSDLYDIFQTFHKSSIQRTIRRAERHGIQISEGRSEWHLVNFYKLFAITRKRLKVPPQPIEWFRNLISCLDSRMNISIALHNGKPIAAMVTLRHKDVVTYKYGGSDERFHSLGGVCCLFWNAIRQAKLSGAISFDFGRSNLENVSLSTFKSRWGATLCELAYWRYGKIQQHKWESKWVVNAGKWSLAKLPVTGLIRIGRLLYRHIG